MFEGVQVTCRSCSEKAILVHCIFTSKMDQNQLFGLKSTFKDQNRLLTRDNNIGRENTVDQNRLLRATSTRDLNSFKHFLGPKNKTLRTYFLAWISWLRLFSHRHGSGSFFYFAKFRKMRKSFRKVWSCNGSSNQKTQLLIHLVTWTISYDFVYAANVEFD